MKKKQTRKKDAFLQLLAQYSALGGALIGSASQAQATIQYATLSGTPVSNALESLALPGGGAMVFREEAGRNSVWLSIGGGLSVSGAVVSFPNNHDAGFLVGAGGAWANFVTQFIAFYNSSQTLAATSSTPQTDFSPFASIMAESNMAG